MNRDASQSLERAQLDEQARSGDPSAQAELVTLHRDALVRFCYRYLGDFGHAEDAAQDVFATLSEGDSWPSGSLRAWLFRAGRNRAIDLLKRRRGGRAGAGSFIGSSALPSHRTGPSTAFARREQEERLREHLAALAPECAEVLVLRYFEDLSREEIAEVMGLSESVVKSRLFKGREDLRRRMREEEG